ncbi:MAG: transporter [Flavobacteriales bacterium]|nr:transporter [Flavobacteriales bacterium]
MRTLAASLFIACGLNASSQGHYQGSSFNPNDHFAPPPGLIVPLYYSYANMDFHNAQGQRSDVLIDPVPGSPTTLSIEQNVRTNAFIAMVLYGGKGKVLGADWGVLVLPTVNNPTANIALDYYSTSTGSGRAAISSSSWGLGDPYVQPLWLSWVKAKWTYGASYGVWLPFGKYSPGSAENVGLGYASHNLRVAAKRKLSAAWSVSAANTLELNGRQEGVDFQEAPHNTLDVGGYHTLAKGHEVGLFAHWTTQLGDDQGTQGSFATDRMFGVGAYGSYWIKPAKFGVLARVVQNLGITDRFGGTTASIGVNLLFLDLPKGQ